MEPLYISISVTIALAFATILFKVVLSKNAEQDKRITTIWSRVDDKISCRDCEKYRDTQGNLNMELIKQMTRIETKLDLVLNGRGG